MFIASVLIPSMFQNASQPPGKKRIFSDLVLNFVNISRDGSKELLPADAKSLHRVGSVTIVEDHRFLNFLS